MPTPRNVSRSLRKTATQLAKIPDVAIAEIADDVTARAIDIGGTFGGRRRRPLIAEARVRGGKRTRTVEVFGRPAGAWVIKTFGRRAVRPVRRMALRIGATGEYRASAGPAGPVRRQSWDRVVEYANERAPELVAEEVEEVIRSG